MCLKLPPADLNSNPYLPHLTSIYTCGVTTALRAVLANKRDPGMSINRWQTLITINQFILPNASRDIRYLLGPYWSNFLKVRFHLGEKRATLQGAQTSISYSF